MIEVELIDDSDSNSYDLVTDTTKHTGSVTVYRQTTLTIAAENTAVNEGDDINIVVSADFRPPISDSLSFDYNLTGVTSDYIDSTFDSTNPISVNDLGFTKESGATHWTAPITIPLRDADTSNSGSDSISLTLIEPQSSANYRVSTTPVDITISDTLTPEISIADASNTYNGENAEFTLTSNVEIRSPGISLTFTPTNNGGSFLNTAPANPFPSGDSGADRIINNVTFSRADPTNTSLPFTYTLEIPTKVDNSVSEGKIDIALVDPTSGIFTLVGNAKTASVTVNQLTTLSITAVSDQVDEGIGPINFAVTARRNPGTIAVTYAIIDAGNYRHSTETTGNQIPISLTFTQSTNQPSLWTASPPISIQLRDEDEIDTADGEFTVELIAGTNYNVAASPNNSATTKIIDDTEPVISIESTAVVIAGRTAELTLTSNVESKQDHSIMVKATNGDGTSFLDTDEFTNEVAQAVNNVRFTGSAPSQPPFTYTLEIPTMDDTTANSGTILVEISTNSSADTYTVHEINYRATITVNKLPVLSIAANSLEIDEGGDLKIIVTSDRNPGGPINVYYSIAQEHSYCMILLR